MSRTIQLLVHIPDEVYDNAVKVTTRIVDNEFYVVQIHIRINERRTWMREKEYIVKLSDITGSIRCALKENIENEEIINQLMFSITRNVETILEDDCEEMTEDMWSAMMV